MVKTGEGFYSSLGFAPLPETFWERSLITRPRDREVVCHASAWDVDNKDDLRIKMCTKVNADDFVTIHHELGHNYYQRAYNQQPLPLPERRQRRLPRGDRRLHRAVDHAGISGPDRPARPRARCRRRDKDTGLLLRQAMDKVAFLPFGLLVDKWRWGVFDGSITPADYNQAWVDLKRAVPGHRPAGRAREADFDPGAKYHIPGNTPYARYFLARILQFQFYKAACDMSGWKGPLHRCSFYGNKEVGAAAERDAGDGRVASRGRTRSQAFTGSREIVGQADARIFRAAAGLAGGAERRQAVRLVD